MAVAKNDGNKEVVGGGKRLMTGLVNVLVKAINPSQGELEAMGIKSQSEPEYVGSNANGNSKVRVDVWLENPEEKFRTKVSFWLEDEVKKTADGSKTQYINKVGKTSYAVSEDMVPEFVTKFGGVRPAYVGEAELIEFIRQWANVEAEGEVTLDTIKDIVRGNVAELQQLVKDLPTNGVKILVGVKDGKYQTVYTKVFGRPYQKSTARWTKELNSQYGQFKADYQGSLEFQDYKESIATPDVEENTEAEAEVSPF